MGTHLGHEDGHQRDDVREADRHCEAGQQDDRPTGHGKRMPEFPPSQRTRVAETEDGVWACALRRVVRVLLPLARGPTVEVESFGTQHEMEEEEPEVRAREKVERRLPAPPLDEVSSAGGGSAEACRQPGLITHIIGPTTGPHVTVSTTDDDQRRVNSLDRAPHPRCPSCGLFGMRRTSQIRCILRVPGRVQWRSTGICALS